MGKLKTFKVDFNEKLQQFNLSEVGTEFAEDGEKWETVHEKCTEAEFTIFMAFIEAKQDKALTMEKIQAYVVELSNFLKLLVTKGITWVASGNEAAVAEAKAEIEKVENES